MTSNEVLRHTHLASYPADLIFEEPFERLTQFEVHFLRKSSHIVVALDDLARDVKALNPVRVNRALCKPAGILYLHGLGIEHVDEPLAYYLAFFLRVRHPLKLRKEFLARINPDDIESETLVIFHDIPELILAEKTVVNEDAGQPVSYGLIEQNRSHGRVNTS